MLQASVVDGLAFDVSALGENSSLSAEVDIGRREIFQALVVSSAVIILDECFDPVLRISVQEVIFEQDAVFQSLVPSFDFALGLRMARRTVDMLDAFALEPSAQIASDLSRTVIGQQARPVPDMGLGHRHSFGGTMSQKSSVVQAAKLASWVLTGDRRILLRDRI